jgi:hypothetical protein
MEGELVGDWGRRERLVFEDSSSHGTAPDLLVMALGGLLKVAWLPPS